MHLKLISQRPISLSHQLTTLTHAHGLDDCHHRHLPSHGRISNSTLDYRMKTSKRSSGLFKMPLVNVRLSNSKSTECRKVAKHIAEVGEGWKVCGELPTSGNVADLYNFPCRKDSLTKRQHPKRQTGLPSTEDELDISPSL